MATVYIYADTAAEVPPFYLIDVQLGAAVLGEPVSVPAKKAATWARAIDHCETSPERYWEVHNAISARDRAQM